MTPVYNTIGNAKTTISGVWLFSLKVVARQVRSDSDSEGTIVIVTFLVAPC